MTTTIQQPPRRRKYNRNLIRRRVRHLNDGNPTAAGFITKSFTRHDVDDHIIHIDSAHATAHCTCEDALFNHKEQCINFLDTCCKHVKRAIGIMEREGTLEPLARRLEGAIAPVASFMLEPVESRYGVVFRLADRRRISIEAYDVYEQAAYHIDRLSGLSADGLDNDLKWSNVCDEDRTAILSALGLRRTDYNDPAVKERILALANDF